MALLHYTTWTQWVRYIMGWGQEHSGPGTLGRTQWAWYTVGETQWAWLGHNEMGPGTLQWDWKTKCGPSHKGHDTPNGPSPSGQLCYNQAFLEKVSRYSHEKIPN